MGQAGVSFDTCLFLFSECLQEKLIVFRKMCDIADSYAVSCRLDDSSGSFLSESTAELDGFEAFAFQLFRDSLSFFYVFTPIKDVSLSEKETLALSPESPMIMCRIALHPRI